jgi:hypothetical protein
LDKPIQKKFRTPGRLGLIVWRQAVPICAPAGKIRAMSRYWKDCTAVAFITTVSQSFKAAQANPAVAVRYE